MSLTYKQARDVILGKVKTAWDPTGYDILWPDIPGDPPTTRVPWARVSIQHTSGEQAAAGAGSSGLRRYNRVGLLTVVINAPIGEGLSTAYDLAKVVSDSFEIANDSDGVWYRSVTIQEAGVIGEWTQTNVFVEFQYDEIK